MIKEEQNHNRLIGNWSMVISEKTYTHTFVFYVFRKQFSGNKSSQEAPFSLFASIFNHYYRQGRSQEFLFGGPSYNSNIFIKITPHTHIHKFFYYIHTYLFNKLYIYTHQTTTKRAQVMFGNSFCFLFLKTCFWEYKEKTIFLYF